MSFGPLQIKAPELGDVTSKGDDNAGCVLAVAVGVAAGGAAGIVAADNLKFPTHTSRSLIGLTIGGLISAVATASCSKKCNSLALCSLLMGGGLGLVGARSLAGRRKKPATEKEKDKKDDTDDPGAH